MSAITDKILNNMSLSKEIDARFGLRDPQKEFNRHESRRIDAGEPPVPLFETLWAYAKELLS